MPELHVISPDGEKFVHTIEQDQETITIGRSSTNMIIVNDNNVSRRHADIKKSSEGYIVEDLNSQNGTLVNNLKIMRYVLNHRDVITIGSCTLMFVDEDTPAQSISEQDQEVVLATLDTNRISADTTLLQKSFNRQLADKTEQFDLEQNNKILYVLFQISNKLNHTSELKELLKTIMDVLFEVIDADYGFIALWDKSREILLPQVIKQRQTSVLDRDEFRVSQTIIGQVIHEKTSVLTSNAMQDDRLKCAASICQLDLKSILSVPLWRKDEVIGMIQLDSCREENQFQPIDLELVSMISRQTAMILDQAYLAELQRKHQFVRETFGRYLSDDIVSVILESPKGLNLGGEKREITILMSDLRGFTATSERLSAVEVVEIINIYLEVMTEIILKYQGTIDEFIGDSILALFGAPVQHPDEPQRAVACALEMQLAMKDVNRILTEKGYPQIEMGIGIHTGTVAVGNVGSKKRTKYGVVGRNVNLTSRIESYTIGGQIFISEATCNACGSMLTINDQMRVMPKGVKEPIAIYDVAGIAGDYQIMLPPKTEQALKDLKHPLPVKIFALEGKHAGLEGTSGRLVRLDSPWADIEAPADFAVFSNLKVVLFDNQESMITDELYAKVIKSVSDHPKTFRINFTSIPPEARKVFSV